MSNQSSAAFVGLVRSVIPGLVTSSSQLPVSVNVRSEDFSYSSEFSSESSSKFSLGTFAKAVSTVSSSTAENSVIVFGLAVA
jgi:hypothetical protein